MFDSDNLRNFLVAPQPLDRIVGWRAQTAVRQGEFLARVAAWMSLLKEVQGQKFALYISDSIEFAAALFGAWQAGKVVYLPADTLPGTCAALERHVDGYLGEFDRQWAPMAPSENRGTSDSENFYDLNLNFPGLVVYTSGSTGAAQAIPKCLRQLADEVATLENLFGARLGSADIVATVSHQHIYGLLFKVLWPLATGRAIHAQSLTYPEQLAQLLASAECVLISSPAHFKRLSDMPAWADAAQRLRAVFSSGGPLPRDVALDVGRLLGQMPIEVYGSSETGGIAWRQRTAQSDESWASLPKVDWRIAEDDHLLEVRSPHLPNAEWYRSSDRVQQAGDNRFVLLGRVDRIVKIEEKRISLDAVESHLRASPLVADARTLVQDGKRHRIVAFVVLSVHGNTQLMQLGKLAVTRLLRDWLSDSVERVGLPRVWRFPGALPINAHGKTTHAELLALLNDVPSAQKMPRVRLLERARERAVFELTAPHELFYFEGHFPGAPILPGVVQIDWAITYGRQCFNLPQAFIGIHALKFQQVIPPELPVTLELIHDSAKSRLAFKLSSQAGQHGSGRIQFGAGDV